MKTSFFNKILILLIAGLFLASCRYDEGPFISIYSKKERVTGYFFFDKVEINGQSETDEYDDQQLIVSSGGSLQWLVVPPEDDPNGVGIYRFASWHFANDKEHFVMDFIEDTIYQTLDWEIKRLTYKDFWIETTHENDKLRWELWKYSY